MPYPGLKAPGLWLLASIWVLQAQGTDPGPNKEAIDSETLAVLSLNVAHARGTSLNQLLVSREGHMRNLADIASLLRTSNTDIAALQEADGPSLWSGRFDHVQHLSDLVDYQSTVHGRHADSWLFSYGAALISRVSLHDTASHSFEPSWPTATKGYVRGSIRWRSTDEHSAPLTVTLVSVHLDFSRKSVRAAQTAELVADLETLPRPLIVMGDFNANWAEAESPVRQLAEQADLKPYSPGAEHLGTYNDSERLDWILISDELVFREYVVLPDVVSDHLAVFARIGLKQ
jgi:endonuclease/exonuclease/phosphatase family metal-dependent hydrolase